MGRWGLEGMRSFEQSNVAKKEGERLVSADSPASKDSENPSGEANSSKDVNGTGDSADNNVFAIDAMAEDEPPAELGSHAIEKRIATLTPELADAADAGNAKALEIKKVCFIVSLTFSEGSMRVSRIQSL